jgi:hypothetical protein
MTKLKLGVISGIVVAGAVTPLVVQHESIVKLRDENQSLRSHAEQQAPLLDRRESQAKPQPSDEMRSNSTAVLEEKPSVELLRLRGQVGVLRRELADEREHAYNARTNSQLRLIEVEAARLREKAGWAEHLKALTLTAWQNLDALGSALNVPDGISKMEAKKALHDPSMKQYERYFQFKAWYERMLPTPEEWRDAGSQPLSLTNRPY